MITMNDKWKKCKNLGPLEYYLHDSEKDGGILEEAVIVPPFSNDAVLNIIKNDWSHLTDHDREIYVYDSTCVTIDNHDPYDSDNTISTYNPLLCFCNYYENSEIVGKKPQKFVLFIKQLTWKETQSEGCGWALTDRECEIYLARTLDDIIKYAMTPDENIMYF